MQSSDNHIFGFIKEFCLQFVDWLVFSSNHGDLIRGELGKELWLLRGCGNS